MQPRQILATLLLALPALGSASYNKLGCYSEVPDSKGDSTNVFQSYGLCVEQCVKGDYKIAILSKGDHCACSNAVPPNTAKVSDDQCNTPCDGYSGDNCGGANAYSVVSTGLDGDLSPSEGSAVTTSHAATSAGGIVVAATNVTPSSIPTSILTAPATVSSSAGATTSTGVSSSASASASPSFNAAAALRGGSSMAGVMVAGLGLLL